MILFGFVIFSVIASFTLSFSICDISYWISLNNITCSTSPNGTYSAVNYNGQCTPSSNDPSKTFYQLTINDKTKTVQNFTVYNDKLCQKANEIFFTKTPFLVNTCSPLFFINSPTSSVKVGNLIFSCKD
jgi:hypothetical protein